MVRPRRGAARLCREEASGKPGQGAETVGGLPAEGCVNKTAQKRTSVQQEVMS